MVFISGWLLPKQGGSLSWPVAGRPTWDAQGCRGDRAKTLRVTAPCPCRAPTHGSPQLGLYVLQATVPISHRVQADAAGTEGDGARSSPLPLAWWLQLARVWCGKPGPAHGTGTHITNATTLSCPARGTRPRPDNTHVGPSARTFGCPSDGTEPGRGRY